MNYREFVGQNVLLGPPEGWNDNREVKCGSLPIQQIETEEGPLMVSIWQPTIEEIRAITAGQCIRLVIFGTIHPSVSVDVVNVEMLP